MSGSSMDRPSWPRTYPGRAARVASAVWARSRNVSGCLTSKRVTTSKDASAGLGFTKRITEVRRGHAWYRGAAGAPQPAQSDDGMPGRRSCRAGGPVAAGRGRWRDPSARGRRAGRLDVDDVAAHPAADAGGARSGRDRAAGDRDHETRLVMQL